MTVPDSEKSLAASRRVPRPRYYRLKVIRGRIERGELDTDLRWTR